MLGRCRRRYRSLPPPSMNRKESSTSGLTDEAKVKGETERGIGEIGVSDAASDAGLYLGKGRRPCIREV